MFSVLVHLLAPLLIRCSVGPYVKVMLFLLKIDFLLQTIGVDSTD